MTLEKLRALLESGAEPKVEVHGLDPMLYVAYRLSSEGPEIFRDGKGRPLHYRSRYAVLRALADQGLRHADFVHRSAYGEMIGVDGDSGATELRETVRLDALDAD